MDKMETVNIKEINNYFNYHDLVKLINEIGISAVRFLVPMNKVEDWGFLKFKNASDTKVSVICYIDESRFKVNDNYKITLVADDKLYGSDDYYTMDLAQLIRDGYIKILK